MNITLPPPDRTVHPRACGEHGDDRALEEYQCGSSPRLRGTFFASADAASSMRFIPAPAGNIVGASIVAAQTTVHPRACGEHSIKTEERQKNNGSSPRLRGTYKMACLLLWFARFIPAPAGNITATSKISGSHPVHPRACGEHTRLPFSANLNPGSSPRLRGTFRKCSRTRCRNRFIPAPAGNMRERRYSR